MPDNYRLRACIGNNEPMFVATRNNVTRVGDPSGPTLLLAHGFGRDQQLWHPVAARLRDHRGGFTRADVDELLVAASHSQPSEQEEDDTAVLALGVPG